jgi:hypothetical protein
MKTEAGLECCGFVRHELVFRWMSCVGMHGILRRA